MLCNGRSEFRGSRFAATLLASSLALTLGACSADVLRFDAPVLGYKNGSGGPKPDRLPPDDTLYSQRPPASGYDDSGYRAEPKPAPSGRIARADLPPASTSASRPDQPPRAYAPERDSYSRRRSTRKPIRTARAPERYTAPREEVPQTITVARGDTLYQISRRYGVPVQDIKSANGLTSNVIKPGQRLVLERGRVRTEPERSGVTPRRTAERTPSPVTRWDGGDTYTVRPGDSLYGISRRTGVRVAAIKGLNEISDVRRLRPGTVLRLRGQSQPSPYAGRDRTPPRSEARDKERLEPPRLEPRRPGRFSQPAAAPKDSQADRVAGYRPSSAREPTIINPEPSGTRRVKSHTVHLPKAGTSRRQPPERRVTSLPPRERETQPPPMMSPSGKFRWPVRGRIVKGFGVRPDGTKNDGIDIAVPFGVDIHAAEAGVVAYAGDELQGYGNLILIRHEGGWVSAYAHSDEMLVKRGDTIRRGQVIARAGKTGNVKRPMVHFELRKGAKPVNPMPHLAQL